MLQRQGNALLCISWEEFIKLSTFDQIRALRMAVWTCCNDWKHNGSELLAALKRWLWIARTKNANFALEIAQFRNYLAISRSLPPCPGPDANKALNGDKSDTKGRNLGSPFVAQLYMFCCSESFSQQRKPYKDIWDIPYSMAGYFYFTFLEMQGNIRVENQEEQEFQKEVSDLEKQAAEESNQRQQTHSGMATEPPDLDQPPPDFMSPNQMNGGEDA